MNPRIRGSDVYVVEDIERMLVALGATTVASGVAGYRRDWVEGYMAALAAVAVSTGAKLPSAVEDYLELVRGR